MKDANKISKVVLVLNLVLVLRSEGPLFPNDGSSWHPAIMIGGTEFENKH